MPGTPIWRPHIVLNRTNVSLFPDTRHNFEFQWNFGTRKDCQAAGVRTGLIHCTCGLPTSFISQWIWSQFTLADHTFVWLSKALYLIFKFAVAHRQSFDDDIRAILHIQACRKQTRTNLEFMHDAHRAVSLYARNWGQVYAKGTATNHVLAHGNL